MIRRLMINIIVCHSSGVPSTRNISTIHGQAIMPNEPTNIDIDVSVPVCNGASERREVKKPEVAGPKANPIIM
uniref:Uncharacterized protein n=1 Tax=Bursaphelenchus xylophilus TaxID=6326 RepID=A0A1I7S3W9_BURXY